MPRFVKSVDYQSRGKAPSADGRPVALLAPARVVMSREDDHETLNAEERHWKNAEKLGAAEYEGRLWGGTRQAPDSSACSRRARFALAVDP
jgi:hypothetical protein